ncbi:hypothetical protein PBRA_007221 [Plasmodiophora brassicae]|uniref:Uncharacterized protein n=1 Tax=Plasmodiophora brassicae TaxID=37360 RepID=A0A0G4IVX1_PLABS|nr:hypothetical protein PBRA_007221 [Plasmodiophora brassicae]
MAVKGYFGSSYTGAVESAAAQESSCVLPAAGLHPVQLQAGCDGIPTPPGRRQPRFIVNTLQSLHSICQAEQGDGNV